MACKRVALPFPQDSLRLAAKRLRLLDSLDQSTAQCAFATDASSSSLDDIPDDVLTLVATTVAARCTSPAELANVRLSCRRMAQISAAPEVLSALPLSALLIPARAYSSSYRAFLRACAQARNYEAAYLLGMIEFYCLGDRKEGVKHLVIAAKAGHAGALHSLAVVHFNGSAGSVPERKLSVGVLLCASAAQQGHVEALRELGHCLQDGYGIKRNVAEGRRLLMEANLREFAAGQVMAGEGGLSEAEQKLRQLDSVIQTVKAVFPKLTEEARQASKNGGVAIPAEAPVEASHEHHAHDAHCANQACPAAAAAGAAGADANAEALSRSDLLQSLCRCLRPLMSDFGCSVPDLPLSPASKFLLDWNATHGARGADAGLKVCGNVRCGRTETRAREFRCCAVCSCPSYCSRACQALDWRAGHMDACQEVEGEEEMAE